MGGVSARPLSRLSQHQTSRQAANNCRTLCAILAVSLRLVTCWQRTQTWCVCVCVCVCVWERERESKRERERERESSSLACNGYPSMRWPRSHSSQLFIPSLLVPLNWRRSQSVTVCNILSLQTCVSVSLWTLSNMPVTCLLLCLLSSPLCYFPPGQPRPNVKGAYLPFELTLQTPRLS